MTGKAKEEAISVLGKWKDSHTCKLVIPTLSRIFLVMNMGWEC